MSLKIREQEGLVSPHLNKTFVVLIPKTNLPRFSQTSAPFLSVISVTKSSPKSLLSESDPSLAGALRRTAWFPQRKTDPGCSGRGTRMYPYHKDKETASHPLEAGPKKGI
jgi:hypothetical protein